MLFSPSSLPPPPTASSLLLYHLLPDGKEYKIYDIVGFITIIGLLLLSLLLSFILLVQKI